MLVIFILALIIHTISFIDWLKWEKEQDKKANSKVEETPFYEIILARKRTMISSFHYYISQYFLIFLLPLFTENILVYFCILYFNYRITSIKQNVEFISRDIETMYELKQYDGVKHFVKYHPIKNDIGEDN